MGLSGLDTGHEDNMSCKQFVRRVSSKWASGCSFDWLNMPEAAGSPHLRLLWVGTSGTREGADDCLGCRAAKRARRSGIPSSVYAQRAKGCRTVPNECIFRICMFPAMLK